MSDHTAMPEQAPDPQDAAKPTDREVPEGLTKARASELIDELQGASPRVDPQ